jgi:protein MAK11
MTKRKRGHEDNEADSHQHKNGSPGKAVKINGTPKSKTSDSPIVQIIVGSYERVLHGVTASLSDASGDFPSVQFADSFLFNAHDSAIRCLALSPLPDPSSTVNDSSQGILLATGGSDEKVNVYSLATSPPEESSAIPPMPTLGNTKISENPRNRELGTILEHSSNITALHFPTRSKLLSASEDNTIAITRVKDLTVVSSIKAPRPKAIGQPSGDTNPQGSTPAGVNDFAVHPSLKLMVSVGKGERCMRLWNLVTGKKAGVLNFSRDILQSVKEGKYSSGEGRRICWNSAGTNFAVAFETGVVVFGEDSKPMCKILPAPLTKLHQISFIRLPDESEEGSDGKELLAVSTEDGRIVFCDTQVPSTSAEPNGTSTTTSAETISDAKVLGHLGGKSAGVPSRIKDFQILPISLPNQSATALVITACSDGAIKVWLLRYSDLEQQGEEKDGQVGKLLGTYETGNRITCLKAFVMLDPVEGDGRLSEFEGFSEDEEGDEESSSSDSDGRD